MGRSGVHQNRARLLEGDVAVSFLVAVMGNPAVKRLLSSEHFSVDGTLIDAWASMKSFRRKDGTDDPPSGGGRNAERNFRNERRSNDTHVSTTDPDARLYRKSDGQPSRLCFMGHLLIENRHGLIVDVRPPHANGMAERKAAEAMIQAAARRRRATLGSDKAYDAAEHIAALRAMTASTGPGVMVILDVAAPAMAPAITGVAVSAGAFQSVQMTRLFSMDEIADVRQKARQIRSAYKPPGQA